MNVPAQIIEQSKTLVEFAPQTIHASYKLFLDYFDGELFDSKVLAGAYMVYGWMPTMLRLKGPRESIFELARAGRDCSVDISKLESCARTLNNSLVGTSKLLHFIAPNSYPIWDSRVYRALFSQNPHPYRVENASVYMDYLSWVVQMEGEEGFESLKSRFEAEAGYSVTSKRVVEATLYALGVKPKVPKAAKKPKRKTLKI